mmetsp:Transcript_20010/g.45324  ORF Transcript_20010/g.45324 Transcript_20010/m.45324 type:complete len:308 (-) Transcript_20010:178-1101(-)
MVAARAGAEPFVEHLLGHALGEAHDGVRPTQAGHVLHLLPVVERRHPGVAGDPVGAGDFAVDAAVARRHDGVGDLPSDLLRGHDDVGAQRDAEGAAVRVELDDVHRVVALGGRPLDGGVESFEAEVGEGVGLLLVQAGPLLHLLLDGVQSLGEARHPEDDVLDLAAAVVRVLHLAVLEHVQRRVRAEVVHVGRPEAALPVVLVGVVHLGELDRPGNLPRLLELGQLLRGLPVPGRQLLAVAAPRRVPLHEHQRVPRDEPREQVLVEHRHLGPFGLLDALPRRRLERGRRQRERPENHLDVGRHGGYS